MQVRGYGMALGLILSAGVLSAGTARAAEPRWYLGVNGGQGEYALSHENLDEITELAFENNGLNVMNMSSSLDDKSVPVGAFGGFRLSSYVALELGYVKLEKTEYRASILASPVGFPLDIPSSALVEISAKGPTAGLLMSAPLSRRIDLHVKASAIRTKMTANVTIDLDGDSASEERNVESTDLLFGFGVAYNLGKHLSLRADWVRYEKVGKKDEMGEGTIETATLGIVLRL